MNWTHEPLSEVAPAERSDLEFAPEEEVWHLNLDQIESDTGRILEKKVAPASEAGNSTYVFDERNVLYSKLRPYLNKVVRPTEPGIATTELVPLRPDLRRLDPDFLTYYLRSPGFLTFAAERVAGAKMPRMIMSKFWQHQIPVPPLPEQRRIVELLDRADALRQQRRAADALAERVLPALFYQMFGDPRDNPKGWDRIELGSIIADGPQNGLYKPSSLYGEGTPILRIDSFYDGQILNSDTLRRVRVGEAERDKYALRKHDIVINRVNSEEYLGKSALVEDLPETTIFESNMMRFSVRTGEMNPLYLILHLQLPYIKGQILQKAKRAVNQASINQGDVKSLLLLNPPNELQDQFAHRARMFADLMRAQAISHGQLDDLFALMLQRAFSGELTATWREDHMKELLQEMDAQAKALARI